MLPTRPQLQGWNPDSLTPAGAGVDAAGESVYATVRGLEDDIERMPEAHAWAGKSHDAATGMFHRGTQQASKFQAYAEDVGSAFKHGDGSIGSARHWLLRAADDIDAGELTVSDAWVVLIKPARLSEAQVAALEARAAVEQADINELLVKVGDADDATAAAMQAAAQRYGFELPDQSMSWLNLGNLPPGDQVPDPRQPDGLEAQKMLRDADKAITVRGSVETFDGYGNRITKLTMQDGSRQEVTVFNPRRLEGTSITDSVQVDHYGRHGEFISRTNTEHVWDGTEHTNVRWGDGTQLTTTKTPDGTVSGEVTTSGGRHGVLPDEFFTHPALTNVGGGLTALEKQSGRGIPGLSASSVAGIGKTAKFVGPALGVGTALYDTATAGTLQKACVAVFSGAAGVAGSEFVGAPVGAAIGAGMGPAGIPIGAFFGDVLGSWTFGYVGGIVGNVVCGR